MSHVRAAAAGSIKNAAVKTSDLFYLWEHCRKSVPRKDIGDLGGAD